MILNKGLKSLTAKRKFEIAIVGNGITGLSTAKHLNVAGFKSIALIAPSRTIGNTTSLNSNYVTMSPIDNASRLVHQHGHEAAKKILTLMAYGYLGLKTQAQLQDLEWLENKLLRIGKTKHEQIEMLEAARLFKQLNVVSTLSEHTLSRQQSLTIQTDSLLCGSTSISRLLNSIDHELKVERIENEVISTKINSSEILISTIDECFECEFLVLANHINSRNFLGELENCLVSYSDQWTTIKFDDIDFPVTNWLVAHANHSQFTFFRSGKNTLTARGARFLRPLEGVGTESVASISNKVSQRLLVEAKELFQLTSPIILESTSSLECNPCDEFPVIGPMFGEHRILVATGYSGNGLSLGFAAGRVLSDFISNGRSEFVDHNFQPVRFRSLTDQ